MVFIGLLASNDNLLENTELPGSRIVYAASGPACNFVSMLVEKLYSLPSRKMWNKVKACVAFIIFDRRGTTVRFFAKIANAKTRKGICDP
jgi:hypothetical protein